MMIVSSSKLDIQNDKIICYIDNSKLEKNKSDVKGYNYNFLDTSFFKYDKSIPKQYDIDKPIYYVIENMTFNNQVKFGIKKDAHILFKNCTFNAPIEIFGNNEGEVVFENNNYYTSGKATILDEPYLNINVENIKFINENFVNNGDVDNLGFSYFGINIKANTIKIINTCIETEEINDNIKFQAEFIKILSSKIDTFNMCVNAENIDIYNSIFSNEEGFIDIKAKETDIVSSCLFSSLIAITSLNINTSKTSIIAKKEIIIENKNNNQIDRIISPLILYNNIYYSLDSKKTDELVLILKRNKLIQILKEIKNKCENTNKEKTKLKIRS